MTGRTPRFTRNRKRSIPGRYRAAPPTEPAPKREGGVKARLWLLALCLAVSALGVGGWRLYRSSLFIVRTVQVSGAVEVNGDIVRETAALIGQSYFEIDAAGAEARIEKLAWVKAASVRRIFPNRIAIAIQERVSAGIWRIGAIDYAVADDGTVLDTVADVGGLPIIDASQSGVTVQVGDHVDADPVRTAVHVMQVLPPSLTAGIVRFEYDHDNGLTIQTDKGTIVRLGDGKDLDYKLSVWQSLVQRVKATDVHELDLRYGDRPFYR